jgi:hypothetical protein
VTLVLVEGQHLASATSELSAQLLNGMVFCFTALLMYSYRFRKSCVASAADRHFPSGVSDVSKAVANGLADIIELIDREESLSILRD